jgi:hypothetical protein
VKLRIDWEVVVRAAALALAVAVPTVVLGATVARDSNVIVLLYFVLLGGQVAAGWYAGRNRLDAPLIHGALASLTSFVVLVVVVVAARAIAGKSGADPFNLAFHAFMSASTGIFGALIATRASKPSPAPSPEAARPPTPSPERPSPGAIRPPAPSPGPPSPAAPAPPSPAPSPDAAPPPPPLSPESTSAPTAGTPRPAPAPTPSAEQTGPVEPPPAAAP